MGDCQRSSLGDEFFHSKSEYGVKMMESVAANFKLVHVKPVSYILLLPNDTSINLVATCRPNVLIIICGWCSLTNYHSDHLMQVSEHHVCKRLLYVTVGDSNERVAFIKSVYRTSLSWSSTKILSSSLFDQYHDYNQHPADLVEKVWDIFLLLPSFIFLALLGYSSPRTHQQVMILFPWMIMMVKTETIVITTVNNGNYCDDNSQ